LEKFALKTGREPLLRAQAPALAQKKGVKEATPSLDRRKNNNKKLRMKGKEKKELMRDTPQKSFLRQCGNLVKKKIRDHKGHQGSHLKFPAHPKKLGAQRQGLRNTGSTVRMPLQKR